VLDVARQIVLPTSSATSNAPDLSNTTPTGLPVERNDYVEMKRKEYQRQNGVN
jgi:hypothetical protein